MQRVRFDHSVESITMYPKVHYDPPSTVEEIRTRFLASHHAEAADSILESVLCRRLEAWTGLGAASRARAGMSSEPHWSAYLSRFTVHFVKGIFAGAGMYTMDAFLVRRLDASV